MAEVSTDGNGVDRSVMPKVSVQMITYNHERYIDQAIESVVSQRTPFPIELVIGEDCSTDGTRAKVAAWAKKYPDLIRPLFHPRNLGMFGNSDATLRACHGEYVACLDGDDYWTDSDKLRLQAECLDQNPEASLCFHLVDVLQDDTGVITDPWTPVEFRRSGLTAEDLMRNAMISALSRMWRRKLLPEIDPRLAHLKVLDIPWNILLAARGRVLFLDRVMGVYRIHAVGAWTGRTVLHHKEASYEWLRCFYDHQMLPAHYMPMLAQMLVDARVQAISERRKISRWMAVRLVPGLFRDLGNISPLERRRYRRWLVGLLLSSSSS